MPLHLPSRADLRREARAHSTSPVVWLREIGVILLLAVVVSTLLRLFVVQVFWIPSSSMRETLVEQDRIAVGRLSAWTGDVKRGDVVVFRDDLDWLGPSPSPAWWETVGEFLGILPGGSRETLVKRVIGVGGDHVTCCDANGRLSVNGVAVDEPYLAGRGGASSFDFDVTVPDGHLWVMGDNRSNSADSRYHMGASDSPFVPLSSVVGVAGAIVWPADRWALVGHRDVFAAVANSPQS
ncbi:signal peptidase I [Schaalia sp. 19OD2882]|nr:signal peptidase I [Schaalia sp. 19OD2882]